MGHILSNPTSYTPTHVGMALEQRLNDTYTGIQTWKMTQSESSMFKLQASLQEDYKMSPYLQTTYMMNIDSRQIIARLRLDMNSLHACMGLVIESAKHLIMECPFYSTQRSPLFEALSQISNIFSLFNENRKLSYILNIGEAKSAEPISKFISNIYQKRRNVVAPTTYQSFPAPHVLLCISVLIFSCYSYIYIYIYVFIYIYILCRCVLWLEWCISCMPIKTFDLIWYMLQRTW